MTFGKRKISRTPAGQSAAQTVIRRQDSDESVPPGMRIAGAWSWRILAVASVIALFIFLVIELRNIVVPFMVAILLAALLVPFVAFLVRHGWPKGLAVAVAEIGLLAVVAGLVGLVVVQVRDGFADLQKQSITAYNNFTEYLLNSPLHLTEADINTYVSDIWASVQRDGQQLASGVAAVGSSAGHFAAGILLVLFGTLFMLIDGKGIWQWFTRLFPKKARPAIVGAGHAGWATLTNFVRVQIFVAFIDAVGIGLGAYIVGLFFGGFPLVIPIAIAVFLGSFIPVVGAVFSGILAIFIALVYLNPLAALIMVGVVILVQQLEGHVLQPFIMGSAVKVHPLAVVFAVAAGGFLAGIPGALFAVPVVATLNAMITHIASGTWRTGDQSGPQQFNPKAAPIDV